MMGINLKIIIFNNKTADNIIRIKILQKSIKKFYHFRNYYKMKEVSLILELSVQNLGIV